IRRTLLMLEILSGRFFLKLNLSDHRRRIIAVTELKIVEWHDYKHLDWILVRRDDDKTYKFKEGDLKRLRLQDIKDMLLLLDKKNRLMRIDELYKFSDGTLNDVRNALDDHLKGIRMQYLPTTICRRGDKYRAAAMIQAIKKMLKIRRIMRSLEKFVGGRLSIVIKRRVEDLQLRVESYQKRLNLTKPDTYRPDLKRREAYTAHSNPRGFIYQNKDKKNRLIRIDELHKFSDGTLNDVRNALDDHAKDKEDHEKFEKVRW
nr:hypothetical protein [Tanacetum cinerariifolium]